MRKKIAENWGSARGRALVILKGRLPDIAELREEWEALVKRKWVQDTTEHMEAFLKSGMRRARLELEAASFGE